MTVASSTATSRQLGHIVDRFANAQPNSTALIIGPQRSRISYADLAQLVDDQCDTLRRSGLRSGDVIALSCANNIEFVVALLGAARAGIVVAPLDPTLPAIQARERVNRVGACLTVTDARGLEPGAPEEDGPRWCLHVAPTNAAGAKPEMRLLVADSADTAASPVSDLTDRDALIMFTSGTTGMPKMVPWTHDNVAASIEGISGAYQLGAGDATAAAMPLFHGHGLIATLLATLATGGALVLPARGRFSAHSFADERRMHPGSRSFLIQLLLTSFTLSAIKNATPMATQKAAFSQLRVSNASKVATPKKRRNIAKFVLSLIFFMTLLSYEVDERKKVTMVSW